MTIYRDDLCRQLTAYKRDVLGVDADGVWARNKKPYPHILPKDLADLNILPSIRETCLGHSKFTSAKLHRDFHHLNSSQAFAINAFFPLLSSTSGRVLFVKALGLPEEEIVDWEFEAVPDRTEATNFDLLVELKSGRRVFIEVKLTEAEFGSVKKSDVQIRRRDEIYSARLEGKVDPDLVSGEGYFGAYQLLRNASYTSAEGDTVIFFVPRGNSRLAAIAEKFVAESITPQYRSHVRVIFAEDFVARVAAEDPPQELSVPLQELRQKYSLGK